VFVCIVVKGYNDEMEGLRFGDKIIKVKGNNVDGL
jgi:hypothetical protein